MFEHFTIEQVTKCAKRAINYSIGYTLFNVTSAQKREYIDDLVGAVYSNDLLEFGTANANVDLDEVYMFPIDDQERVLTHMMERYVRGHFRTHTVTRNGQKYNSTVGFNSIKGVDDDGRTVDFDDVVPDTRRSALESLMEMEAFNTTLKSLKPNEYKAVEFLMRDLVEGTFGSYVSDTLTLKFSEEALRIANEYLMYKKVSMVRDLIKAFVKRCRG